MGDDGSSAPTCCFLRRLRGFVAGLLQQQPAPAPGADGRRRGALPLLNIGVSAALPALLHYGGGVPQGYVRLLVFDADSNLVSQQVQTRQPSAAAASGYEPLTVRVVAAQDGYVTAYVGNESNADVYFDDVQVVLGQGLQVQENSYDPYGLSLAGLDYASPDIKGLNQYQFNGKERQTDLGLGWNDHGWRNYDPTLGRWHSADLLAEKAVNLSPYRFGFNNPVRFFDPLGLWESTEGGYTTRDRKDIERFTTFLQAESALGNKPDISQTNGFVKTEMQDGMGQLSNGNLLADGFEIVSYRSGYKHGEWMADGQSLFKSWKGIQNQLAPASKDNAILGSLGAGLNGLGMTTAVHEELWKSAARLGGSFSQARQALNLATWAGRIGLGIGGVSAGLSFYKPFNKPIVGNAIGFGVDSALIFAGPVGGIIAGLAEATGAKDAVITAIDEKIAYDSFMSQVNQNKAPR